MKVSITKKVEFATGHRLMNDPGKCHRLHGHNFEAEVTVSGSPDETGWIMPFKELKNSIWNITKDRFDHKMLIESDDKSVGSVFKENDIEFFETPVAPTTEGIAAMIHQYVDIYLCHKVAGVVVEKVRVYEDQWQYAEVTNEQTESNEWQRKIMDWASELVNNDIENGK